MSVFAKGVIAVIVVPGFLFGTVFLLMSMVLGAKVAYLVEACVVLGCLTLISAVWAITALGPIGIATAWTGASVGQNISPVHVHLVAPNTPHTFSDTFDVANYPNTPWQAPAAGKYIADLHGSDDTLAESLQLQPVLNTLVSSAISPIPGVRTNVAPLVHGSVNLISGQFTVVNVLMEQATVAGKTSVIAEGEAVPSTTTAVPSLPGGVTSATIDKYLVSIGQKVNAGDPIMQITLPDGTTANLPSGQSGSVAALGPDVGALIRANVPIMTLNISGEPGQPQAVDVVAIRIRGNQRTPATLLFLISLLLFLLHLFATSRYEKAKKSSAAVTAASMAKPVPLSV